MIGEIQFFMREKDQSEFLEFVANLVDSIELVENDAQNTHRLLIGDCQITFRPSPVEGNTLFVGRLGIKTGSIDSHCAAEERAKVVWRKIKAWLKKHYWSRLAYLNKLKKNKLTPSRNYWVGPAAKRWKEENPQQHIFRLSATSWMVFEIGI